MKNIAKLRPPTRWTLSVLLAMSVAVGTAGMPVAVADDIAMAPAPGDNADQHWPRWRGPSGQGVVPDGNYPDQWSDTDNVIWRVAVPGAGNSSPVIWDDQIFLTTAYDNGRRRSILSFDRATGEQRWETFAPVAADPEGAHGKNGWASGTPSTDGERVYAYLGNHGLVAVDLAGEVAWHVSLGDISSLHGSACSPFLHEGNVIIYQDKPGGGFVAAFNAATGEEVWRTPREARVGWGSPVVIDTGEREELIVSSQHRVTAYDPATGTELWTCQGNSVEVTPTPVVGHGLVFASSGRAGPTLAIRPGGSGDVTDTHVVWSQLRGSPFIPSPLLYGDFLYMVTDTMGVVTCYRADTGELVWRERLPAETTGEAYSASPIGVDGRVYFTRDSGETFVLRAGPDFEVLQVNQVGEPMLASPALLNGRWYMRTQGHLICVGQR